MASKDSILAQWACCYFISQGLQVSSNFLQHPIIQLVLREIDSARSDLDCEGKELNLTLLESIVKALEKERDQEGIIFPHT